MNTDLELYNLICKEQERQKSGIELIASENFTSKGVLECLGSCLTNKYAEGLPGKRYYGGNKYIDEIEKLCIKRALHLFNLDENEWDCNVQPYSGSVANLAVYLALLNPGDTLMGLDLPSGGHLTHGFETPTNKVTSSATYYKSVPYKVGLDGLIDYDQVEKLATENKPKLIICGASAYARDFDYKRFRQIADINQSYLMADIAHINAFIASGLMNNPFEFCDVVTTTTHKALRGPRAGIIFFKKHLAKKINDAVFPGLQGGPHENQIAAVAFQLRECATPEFKEYSKQVLMNSKELAKCFIDLDYEIVTGGTDNHLFLINLKNKKITGSRVEKILEAVEIYINKNTVPGDTSALNPSGIRIGTCAITTKGMKEFNMKNIADFIDRAINIAIKINSTYTKLDEFCKNLESEEIKNLRNEVINFTSQFNHN